MGEVAREKYQTHVEMGSFVRAKKTGPRKWGPRQWGPRQGLRALRHRPVSAAWDSEGKEKDS